MRLNPVLSAVLREPWMIEPQSADAMLPYVYSMLEKNGKEDAAEQKEKKEPVMAVAIIGALSSSDRVFMSSFSSYDQAPAGSIAIHRIEGAMMKEDYCDSPGTVSMGRWIQEADAHENIIAHVGWFNSPGGTVAGTESFSGTITSTVKPFVSFGEQMCSAAYWAGSGANLIIAAGKTAMIGSIGTMTTITDYSAYYEKFGIKTRTIRATDSVDKNEPYLQALAGNTKPMQKLQLDPLNAAFTGSVKENREGKLDLKAENVLTGKVYIGEAIVEAGLADELGTFEYAVQRAAELAAQGTGESETYNQPNSNTQMFGKNKFKAVAALAGKKGEEVTAELVDAANEELEANGIEGAALITEAQHAAFEASVKNEATLKEQLAAAQTENTTLKAENEKLGKKPGASSTNVAKEGTELKDEPSVADANAKLIAELPHNKAIADNPRFN